MGLESQLSNVSSESIPILIFATISKCACYLLSRILAILRRIRILPAQNPDPAPNDVVGSGLANLVVLAEQLNLNRVFSYKHDCDDVSSMKCVVCLDGLEGGDEVRKLACGHVFHKRCFDGWLDQMKFNCPLCRAELLSDGRVDSTRRLFGEDGVAWFSALR